MKHKGSFSDFTRRRNQELLRAFNNIAPDKRNAGFLAIGLLVAKSPSSRFWVSEERAAIVVSQLLAGKNPLKGMLHTKRDMFTEIFRRFIELRNKHPRTPALYLISRIVNSPAPEFYMAPRYAIETLYKIRNGFYDKR